jgi:ABC-type antimicrobial peptide transport system permease subunit
MKSSRTIRTALRALRRNPMRVALTILGIVIGIAAVIAMMEIGNGSSEMIKQAFAGMGTNTILVLPGAVASGGISYGMGSSMTLTPEDCDAIIQQCPAVLTAAPVVRAGGQIVYGNKNWTPPMVYGTTDQFLIIRDWQNMSAGDMFSERDVRNSNMVCVIGQTLVRELFEGANPIGKEIRVRNVSLRVVGVLASKGAAMMGMDQDDIVIAPWTTVKYRITGSSYAGGSAGSLSSTSSTTSTSSLYPNSQLNLYPPVSSTQATNSPKFVRFTNVDQIMVSARSTADIPAVIEQITQLLRERHRILAGDPDDFDIRNMTEMIKTLTNMTTLMANLLLCVALISLVVGGVGIMNIMLVSVTERTREIGLRMAVGARGKDILRQFLVEAVVLCLAGGILGILLGHGGSYLVKLILKWPISASPAAIISAVVVSASIGIIFGFYPAWKGSRLDPIEALRYE